MQKWLQANASFQPSGQHRGALRPAYLIVSLANIAAYVALLVALMCASILQEPFSWPLMPQLCLNASFLALRDLTLTNTFPSPDAATSVSNLAMEPAPAGLLKMSALCVQAHTNRMIVRTKNLPNVQTATVHILPPAHTQTGWLSEQRISQMSKLQRCTSCHQQGMPSIPHWEKSPRDPSGESLHTTCSEGASRADHLSWNGSKLVCPSLSQQPSRPGQPQSGPQLWERQIAGSDHYTLPG